MQKVESRKPKQKAQAKSIARFFKQVGFSPLQTRTRIITVMVAFMLLFTACCAPATTSNTSLPETAFIATFLGVGNDGQTLLAKPEQSNENVQLIYDKAFTLPVGQRVYVVGRLEGNLVYVTDLRLL